MDEATKKAVIELELAHAALNDATAKGLRTDEGKEHVSMALGRAQARVELAIYRLTGRFPAGTIVFAKEVQALIEAGEMGIR